MIFTLNPTKSPSVCDDYETLQKNVKGSDIQLKSKVFGFNPDNVKTFTYLGESRRGGFIVESFEIDIEDIGKNNTKCFFNNAEFWIKPITDISNIMDYIPRINPKISSIFNYVMDSYNLSFKDIINGTEKSIIRNIRLKDIKDKNKK